MPGKPPRYSGHNFGTTVDIKLSADHLDPAKLESAIAKAIRGMGGTLSKMGTLWHAKDVASVDPMHFEFPQANRGNLDIDEMRMRAQARELALENTKRKKAQRRALYHALGLYRWQEGRDRRTERRRLVRLQEAAR